MAVGGLVTLSLSFPAAAVPTEVSSSCRANMDIGS